MCVTHLDGAMQKLVGSDGNDNLSEDLASFNCLYETDEFRMFALKVLPCSKRAAHNWQTCVFAHFGEKARRRDLRTHQYSSQLCPDVKKEGGCPRGDGCPLSHNIFEAWLHPELYRTQMCTSGTSCTRAVCFFAHTPEQLRTPSNPSKQQQQQHPSCAGKQATIITAAAADAKQQQQHAMLRANVAAAAAPAVLKGRVQSPLAVPGIQQQEWGSNTLSAQPSNVQLLLQPVSYSSGISQRSSLESSTVAGHQLLSMVSSSSNMVCSSPMSLECSSSCAAIQPMAAQEALNISALSSPMSSSSLIPPAGLGFSTVTNVASNTNDMFAAALQQLGMTENTPAGTAVMQAGLLCGAVGSPVGGLAGDIRLLQPTNAAATLLQQQQEQIQQQRLVLLQQEQQLQQQQAMLQQLQFMNFGLQPVALFN